MGRVNEHYCDYCEKTLDRASMATSNMCWGCSSSFKEACEVSNEPLTYTNSSKRYKNNYRSVKRAQRKKQKQSRRRNR